MKDKEKRYERLAEKCLMSDGSLLSKEVDVGGIKLNICELERLSLGAYECKYCNKSGEYPICFYKNTKGDWEN